MTDQRSRYVEYISKGVRYALKETGKRHFPDTTRLIVFNTYSPLCGWSQLLGFNILVTDIPSSYEFCLAIASEEESNYKLLKAFLEYLELYPMENE